MTIVCGLQEVAPAAGSTYFVPMAKADDATERGLSLRSAIPDAGVNNFILSAEAARLDVQADEVGLTYGCVSTQSFLSLSFEFICDRSRVHGQEERDSLS